MDPVQPWASAVAIRAGRFVFVGDDAGAAPWIGPATVVHDLDGSVVLPGLIDSHTHPGQVTGSHGVFLLPRTLDRDELLAAVAEASRTRPGGSLLVGGYWPISAFGLEGPSRHDLDRVVADRPVLLLDDSGHSQWLNSAALALFGIDRHTPDPVAGFSCFVRDAAGDPTGWVKEFALQPVAGSRIFGADVDAGALEAFLRDLVAHGVVAVFDGGNREAEDAVYAALAAMDRAGRLPLRYEGSVHVLLPGQLPGAIDRVAALQRAYGGRRLRINTVKLVFDGVTEVGTAALLDPYVDGSGCRGNTLVDGETLRGFIVALHEARVDLHMHTVGDAAVRTALDAVEAARRDVGGPLATQVSLSHLEVLDPADVPRFAALGVVANHTPHWHGGYFGGADRRLGAERYERMYAVRPLLDAGAIVAFSSDITDHVEWTTGRANPFVGMQVAHTRREIGTDPSVEVRPPADQRLSLEALVRGYTRGSAFQLGLADELGSITPGRSADLVVLDRDLFAVGPDEVHAVTPIAVLIQGELAFGVLP